MQKCKFGNSDLEVSAIGVGCVGLSFGYASAVDKQESISHGTMGDAPKRIKEQARNDASQLPGA
jgi:aryl-alcohol dehydrogenase-like predicted oxidoreductase